MSHLRLIVRGLAGRPGRNVLTALGIAIGIGAFVSLVALAESFTTTMRDMFASRRTDVSVVRTDSPDVLMSSLPQSLWPQIAAFPGVAVSAPVLAEMLWAEGQPASLVMGMASGSFLLEHFQILEGRSIVEGDGDVALVGQALAERLDKKLGDPFEVESRDFRIVGIYDAGNTLENAGAVLPLDRLQWLLNREDEVTAINLRVTEGSTPEQVAAALGARFRNLNAIPTNAISDSNLGLDLARTMSWATSLVALAIGLVGTLNSMLMTVLERTREMGLLRALGWRRTRICAVLLGESLALSLAGGLAGLAFGTVALRLALQYPAIRGLLSAGLTPPLAAKALGLALLLGLLGGILPALRGSSLAPTEALRHE